MNSSNRFRYELALSDSLMDMLRQHGVEPSEALLKGLLEQVLAEADRREHKGYERGVEAAVSTAVSNLTDMLVPSNVREVVAGGRVISNAAPLEILGLNPRTLNLLRREGWHTVGDVLKQDHDRLLEIDGINDERLYEVSTSLNRAGFDW